MKRIIVCLQGILLFSFLLISCDMRDDEMPESSAANGIYTSEPAKTSETSETDEKDIPDITIPKAVDIENRFMVTDAFPGIDFVRPLDLQNVNDGSGRIFVVEQRGLIWVLQASKNNAKELFLDISASVDTGGNEMGLLGLAFHPGFNDNGHFYVNYTNSEGTVIARFTTNGNTVDTDSRIIVLSFDQPYMNHNGGQLAFGADGYLYIAAGDGGGRGDPLGNGQDLSTFHGKILRIDVDGQSDGGSYTIPEDNPFADNTRGFLEEIYAYGLRNPWRFSFDPVTNKLWTADVGQNTVGEINIIQKGGNYGWNIMEGSRCFNPRTGCDTTGLELPVYEYVHPIGRSITGGYVYRGEDIPMLYGAYIYADYITGLIWGLWHEKDKDPVNYILADTDLNISSFGVDEKRELYMTAFDGRIYKIMPK